MADSAQVFVAGFVWASLSSSLCLGVRKNASAGVLMMDVKKGHVAWETTKFDSKGWEIHASQENSTSRMSTGGAALGGTMCCCNEEQKCKEKSFSVTRNCKSVTGKSVDGFDNLKRSASGHCQCKDFSADDCPTDRCKKESDACTCKDNISGDDCSIPPCASLRCSEHFSSCSNTECEAAHSCIAQPTCIPIQPCALACSEHSTCSNKRCEADKSCTAQPVCQCTDGYTGDRCEKPPPQCSDNQPGLGGGLACLCGAKQQLCEPNSRKKYCWTQMTVPARYQNFGKWEPQSYDGHCNDFKRPTCGGTPKETISRNHRMCIDPDDTLSEEDKHRKRQLKANADEIYCTGSNIMVSWCYESECCDFAD